MMDLQKLLNIIDEMKRNGLTINGDTLTAYTKQHYPIWFDCIEYPPGAIAQILKILQEHPTHPLLIG